MNVAELIKRLSDLDPELTVCLETGWTTEAGTWMDEEREIESVFDLDSRVVLAA